jgi:RNA polymerase sigma-70 factor (ECF subfamily)
LTDLTAAARRDRFRAIYDANYHRILGYALRRAGPEDAHDLVAETFLVTWRRLEEVPEGEAALLWLYGTARRVLANQRRAVRRRVRLRARLRAEPALDIPIAAPDRGLNAAAAAFARLRPEDRELLALVAWEGLEAGEIAEVCGCSPNAARIRVHRARRRFARELAQGEASVKHNRSPGHASEAYD